ncbi:MAG: carboxypeptidase-like regulatory domain-containing protein [Prevotella sp.]|nr:carboxypeptidase-like regulatory domain-containing protein [Prevotella sp.]
MRRIITVLSCLLFAVQLTQAQVQITGKVIDSNTRDPLIGVGIIIVNSTEEAADKRSKSSTITDINGRFTLTVPDMNSEIKVSYIGYQEKTIKAGQDMTIELDEYTFIPPRKDRREVILTTADRKIIEHVNGLALRLMRELPKQQSAVFSPLSIACLLSLTNDGAAAQTQKELTRLLGALPEETDSFYRKMTPYLTDSRIGSRFLMANALFVNSSFQMKRPFQQQATDNYEALVRNMDFTDPKAVQEVNDWCARQTEGMIPRMVDTTEQNTLLFGLNAVFFDSNWDIPFKEEETKDEIFTMENGTRKKLPLMHQKSLFSYAKGKGYTALKLPYKGEVRYDMTLILPDKGQTVADVLSSLSPHALQQLQQQSRAARVDVKIPRFATEVRLHLNELLCQLGIPTAFNDRKADFSRMADVSAYGPGANLALSKMLQKAKIEVNEEGTRAAAVTLEEMIITGYAGKPQKVDEYIFHADRPFLYLITERTTGTILFIGQYHGE